MPSAPCALPSRWRAPPFSFSQPPIHYRVVGDAIVHPFRRPVSFKIGLQIRIQSTTTTWAD